MASRRNFLGMTAGLAASGALHAQPKPDNLPPNVPAWMKEPGHEVNWRPYGLPVEFEKHVVKFKRPSVLPTEGVSLTPFQHLHGVITPSGLIFERQHGGVPIIDPAQHRLMLHGLVKRPLLFTMEDLLRFPSESHIYFLECSGNTSRDWRSPVSRNVQETHGLLSCCEWTGVPLGTLLEEAGLQPQAKWVLAEGVDAGPYAQPAARQVPRRHPGGLRAERRDAAARAGLSAAPHRAGLGRQRQREMAAGA